MPKKVRIKISIPNVDGRCCGWWAIDAYTTASPHLFTHKQHDPNKRFRKPGWTVTHGATGCSCGDPFDTREQALAFAAKFSELVDVSFTTVKECPRNVGDEWRFARRFAFTPKERRDSLER